MNSRERVKMALAHRQPDRVPLDFGSTAVTGMHATCVAQLRDHYGLERRPVKIWEPFQMLGDIEPDLLDALGVDTVKLPGPANMFGFRNENWKEWRSMRARRGRTRRCSTSTGRRGPTAATPAWCWRSCSRRSPAAGSAPTCCSSTAACTTSRPTLRPARSRCRWRSTARTWRPSCRWWQRRSVRVWSGSAPRRAARRCTTRRG